MKEKIVVILNGLRPEFDFNEPVNFIEEGMLDSFDVINLILLLAFPLMVLMYCQKIFLL